MELTPKKDKRRSHKQRHQEDGWPCTDGIERIRGGPQRGHIGFVSANRGLRIRIIDHNPNAANGVAIIPEELHKIFIEQERIYPLRSEARPKQVRILRCGKCRNGGHRIVAASRACHRLPGGILRRGGWRSNFCGNLVCGLGSRLVSGRSQHFRCGRSQARTRSETPPWPHGPPHPRRCRPWSDRGANLENQVGGREAGACLARYRGRVTRQVGGWRPNLTLMHCGSGVPGGALQHRVTAP